MCQVPTGNERDPCPWGAHSLEKWEIHKQIIIKQCISAIKNISIHSIMGA